MRYSPIHNDLFIRNRKKISDALLPNSLAVFFSNDEMPRNGDQFFPYRQNSDFFYLTGIEQENTILVLCPSHQDENLREIVFTVMASEKAIIYTGYKNTYADVSKISGIKSVKWQNEFEKFFSQMSTMSENIYLNTNENSSLATPVITNDLRFVAKAKRKFPLHNFCRLAPLMQKIRLIKEPEEIALMQKACAITNLAFQRVLSTIAPEQLEYEIEAEITHEFIKNGSSGHAYAPIIASGEDACILHYIKNNKKCNNGELLLMDFGAEYANYAADCTRTIPINGKFTKRQRQLYDAVLRVFKQSKKMLIPNITIAEYNKKVDILWEQEHISLGLYTHDDLKNQDPTKPLVRKYYPHGTSHFMGLDVHDIGHTHIPLEAGMVLSCEPGIYIQEESIGIRLENNIVVGTEPLDLMENIPIEPAEIEELMRR